MLDSSSRAFITSTAQVGDLHRDRAGVVERTQHLLADFTLSLVSCR